MEKKLNFLSRFKISSFKIKQYSLLLKDGLNKAIGYALILSLIIGIFLGAIQFTLLTTIEKELKIALEKEEFEFEMNEGVLDFKASPYKLEEGGTVIIIDSNKTLNDSESFRNVTVHKDISTVFVKDGIIVRENGNEYKLKYTEIPIVNKSINNQEAINILNKVKPIKYIVFIAMIVITYISILFKALVISLIGIISNKMNGSKLKYKDILKISLYSLTVPVLINLIFPMGSLTILIAGIYVTIAINNINKEKILL